MSAVGRVPVPPVGVPGTVQATWRDAGRLWIWQVTGWFYGALRAAQRGRPVAAALNSLYAVVGLLTPYLLIPVYIGLIAAPSTSYRFDSARTAVLAVSATRDSWSIHDHVAKRPGDGAGRRLRRQLLPTLLADADRRGILVTLETSVPELADAYCEDIEGLRKVGKGVLLRRLYRRDPVPGAESR